jgi:ubiquinone/menaquinone biosynthesis C-methylase UbiE
VLIVISKCLTAGEVLDGYDAVSILYLHIPSLSHWRAWEYAAYQHYQINGRILDLGCGDGRYFRLIWPQIADVVGVDMNGEMAKLSRQSGIYRKVHVALAHHVPEPDAIFDHVFANSSYGSS